MFHVLTAIQSLFTETDFFLLLDCYPCKQQNKMFAYLKKKENILKFGTTLDTHKKNDNTVLVLSQLT